jgi:hypothetical protein
MHHLRLALIGAVLCGASYGCATPADQSGANAPASGTFRTGSRLPSYDSDGSSSTGAVSKDDYTDQMNRSARPTSAH